MEKKQMVKKLGDEQDVASWKDLRIHATRDAILLVSNGVPLAEVAAEFALDNKEQVAMWIENKDIQKPDSEFLNEMEKNMEKQFAFIIVQPFVLIHDLLN